MPLLQAFAASTGNTVSLSIVNTSSTTTSWLRSLSHDAVAAAGKAARLRTDAATA